MAEEGFVMDLGPLNERARAVAEKELRETPENVEKGLAELRQLLRNDENIFFGDDDDFLMIFLRPCKFYPKSAYELMVRVAKFKDNNKSLLQDLMPQDERVLMCDTDVVNVLKDRDQLGRRVLIFKCGDNWNPKQMNVDNLFRVFYLMHEIGMLEPETQVCGVVVIMDFEKLTMKQVMAITPAFCMRFLTFVQEAMPLRLKQIHMVKQPMVFNLVWNMFKPFIKEKLRKRINFHGDKMAELHKYIDRDYLPENYGGTKPKINYTCEQWYPNFIDHMDHINNWNRYGSVKG